MHDSIMIAEVGDIENVSGSRIATPLAPPSPGSTPISTPSVMPTNISATLVGVSTTAKPWINALSSSILICLQYFSLLHDAEAAPSTHEPDAAKRTPRIRLCRSAGVAPSRGSGEAATGVVHFNSRGSA